MKRLGALLFLWFIPLLSISQDFLSRQFNDRYFSAYIGTGSSTYFGELNFNDKINARPSSFTLGVEARLLNHVGARLALNYLSLSGDDKNAPDNSFQRQRNLSFKSNNFQIQLTGVYYIKSYNGAYHSRRALDLYLVGGIGYLKYNPTAEFAGERFLLRKAQTEGFSYKKWTFTIPIGAGVKFRINEFLNVNVEMLYHKTFTDYLDDVSSIYGTDFLTSTAEFLSDRKNEIGVVNPDFYDQIVPGAKRGDPATKDAFLMVRFNLEMFLPPNLFKSAKKVLINRLRNGILGRRTG